MNRRQLIKTMALAGGAMFVPGLGTIGLKKKPLYMVIIGDQSSLFMKDFCDLRPDLKYIFIGREKDVPFDQKVVDGWVLDCDFGVFQDKEPQQKQIREMMTEIKRKLSLSNNRCLIVAGLNKPTTHFSKGLIRYIHQEGIDFQFLGITALLHSSLTSWAKNELLEFRQDSRISLFDVDGYLGKLREMNGDILFSEAAEMLDGELVGRLLTFGRLLLVG